MLLIVLSSNSILLKLKAIGLTIILGILLFATLRYQMFSSIVYHLMRSLSDVITSGSLTLYFTLPIV